MSFFLMPITLFIKYYLPVGYLYLAEIDIYLFMILALAAFISKNKNELKNYNSFQSVVINYLKRLADIKVFAYILVALLIQILAIIISYFKIGDQPYNVNPVVALLAVVVLWAAFFLHYVVINVLIDKKKDIIYFIKGVYWTTVVMLLIVYSQLLYIKFPFASMGKMMDFFGKYFEQRNQFVPQWYEMGSYVQTMHRVNGFFSEPAKLAAFLCIICLPFILAAIKNNYSIFNPGKKYQPLKYYSFFCVILIALFYAKTTTGMVAIVLAVGVFWISLPLKRKITSGIVILVALLAFITLYFTNNSINQIISEYLIGKTGGNSTNNRLGGTLGLIYTFLQHPILGVGQSYVDFYQLKNIPKWATNNWEYESFTQVRHSFPIYSILIGWFVQYGIAICAIFCVYLIKLKRSTTQLVDKLKKHSDYTLYKTINDAALYFMIFYFVLLLLTFGWNESAFFVMFFFFVVFRQYLKKIIIDERIDIK